MIDAKKGIIFQGPMVVSIGAGRKTQTRRPLDESRLEVELSREIRGEWPIGHNVAAPPGVHRARMNPQGAVIAQLAGGIELGLKPGEFTFRCPYLEGRTLTQAQTITSKPGGERTRWKITPVEPQRRYVKESLERSGDVAIYSADASRVAGGKRWPWPKSRRLSSLHMPRDFARYVIEPLVVYVERLKLITREDAIAEGAYFTDYGREDHGGKPEHQPHRPGWSMVPTTHSDECHATPVGAFGGYFNRIHAGPNWNLKPGLAPFELDPWVWAIAFKVHHA